jgi:arylsulfatase A-like enzyme
VLIAPIIPLFALSTGRQIVREARGVAALPTPAANAPNVLFIVMDTVRASNLGLYGYDRDTTPNLSRWAKKGVVYERALAPAPWTFPSHSSFFTGRWPMEINSQWKYELDPTVPTLAEFLTSRGYQSTGFAANTNCCNYETGLGRGFLHFEDYSLAPRSLLSRTVPGKWMLERFFSVVEPYQRKWTSLQSRGARDVNDAFLGWEGRRRRDRPFFAFLNYFDAHEPFIPPAETVGRFGVRPKGMRDYQFLVDYVGVDKSRIIPRDFIMARDAYDDCIAHLDDQIGRLLDELERRGALKNTVVVITSDHGEAFAEHGTVGHSYSVNLEEVRVPLLILAPKAPAGRRIYRAISLRDIASTVTDLSGLSDSSPFPGRSLTAYWKLPPGPEPAGLSSPAFSEQAGEAAFLSSSAKQRAENYQMSLVALSGYQYIRNGTGQERLYYLWDDPSTQRDILTAPEAAGLADEFRRMLLRFLDETPGAPEAEKAYLKTFRKGLADAIGRPPEQQQQASSLNRPPE